MAEIVGKDEATYAKERDGFLRDLRHFHETRGTPFKRCPTLGGKEVDLYLLYNLVTSDGGWMKVNSKNSWSAFLPHFKLPPLCVNGSIALKQIYLRFLDRWEKVHNLGDEADRTSDDDEESRHRRWSSRALHSVPHAYNYNQHNVPDDKREYHHMDFNLYKPSDYDRLALSLISPLPNEQDFAINVCTLLSNDSRHTLKLDRHPRLITYLLAHAGIFTHSSLRQLFTHFYADIRKKPIHTFWSDVLESEDFLDLTNETKFYPPRAKEDAVKQDAVKQDAAKPCDSLIKDDSLKFAGVESTRTTSTTDIAPAEKDVVEVVVDNECEIVESGSKPSSAGVRLESDDNDRDFFCLRRTLGTQDYIGQRVLQIATILRNLCFIEENLTILTRNSTFVRFLLLCANSQWNTLRNLGLDMLGNVALELELKDGPGDIIGTSILKLIGKNIQSDDRASCLSSVEVLNKLSQNEKNEDVLIKSLESTIYKKVCSFLTIHDVMLLIYTLECLYSLSSLGERSCTFIANNHGVIDTLVSLVTVEGKSYGPKACIGMKLVETIPTGGGQLQTTTTTTGQGQQSPQPSPSPAQVSPTATTASASSATTANVINSLATIPAAPSVTPVKVISSTPLRNVPLAPQRLLTTPMQVMQQPHTLQQLQPQQIQLQPLHQPPPSPQPPQPVAPIVKTVTPLMTTPNKPTAPTVTTTTSTIAPPVVIPQLTPQQMIQQQHAQQQAIHENEQFALAWLRATYEPCMSDNKIDHQELYKHYLTSCSKIGRRGVISPLHFPRCVRSVFGGTVGPNPMKPANPSDPQYYEGIKVRAQPLKLNIIPPSSPPKPFAPVAPIATPKPVARRRVKVATVQVKAPVAPPLAADGADGGQQSSAASQQQLLSSPASPILKAQLSAPPKQREGGSAAAPTPADSKSQAVAHPHLSQALLGSSTSTTVTTSVAAASTASVATAAKPDLLKGGGEQAATGGPPPTNSSSLIKSLLATKVNDACMPPVSMKSAATTDCQNVAQVAARQQRLLAQQGPSSSENPPKNQSRLDALKMHRINGARQLFTDNDIRDPSVSSTTQFVSTIKGKKEPPQPPPPPLAPLSNAKAKTPPVVNEDSDSIGTHSLSSTSGAGVVGIVSSTEDNENSLTSFEGLLNGMPIVEESLNESSNSKDSVKNSGSEISINKPLRLADLLEKKFDKNPSLMNGAIGIDLKMIKTEKQDLIENHIEKVLTRESSEIKIEIEDNKMDVEMEIEAKVVVEEVIEIDTKQGVKRHATEQIADVEAKKMHLSSGVNGAAADSPVPDSSSSNGDEGPTTVSTAAAKLFADIAADILEDEEEEQLLQEVQAPPPTMVDHGMLQQQIIVDNNQQMLISQPRQIIVSQSMPMQSASQSVVISSGTQLKTQSGQTVIVQNAGVQQRQSVLIQPANAGQLLLSQGLQGQVQLVPGSQPGQYVIQTNPSQGYVVAQSQTAVVHGQPQTVLVAQQGGQNTGAKTIIILQQQAPNAATHHQKVMVTPQGQQVVVTQVPRPVVHSSTVTNNIQQTKIVRPTPSPSPALSNASTSSTISNGVKEIKQEDLAPKVKIIRDLTTPFVCEWGDCVVDAKFKSPNEVYMHACASHCPQGDEEVICQWDRCDMLKRKRFSLMTHLHDKHCNIESMKQSLVRRKRVSQGLNVEPPPPSPNTHTGYAPDAALHAIKRHALEFVNPKELQIKSTKQGASTSIKVLPPPTDQDDNEGPVTKSIRLTASLILRNLVIYSSNCKRYLKSYESHLANIALSNVESSRTIAQILYDINDGASPR